MLAHTKKIKNIINNRYLGKEDIYETFNRRNSKKI